MNLRLRRSAALIAGGALAATGALAAAPAPHASAAVDPDTTVADAATWLDGQRDENGLFTYADFLGNTSTDVSTTIDFALGLASSGASPELLDDVVASIDAALPTYVGEGETEYVGGLARAAYLHTATGTSTTVGDIDLGARLEEAVDENGQLGGFPDVYAQVFAVPALDALDSVETNAATEFLIAQQCAGEAWGYTYDGVCTSDVDATAWTVRALVSQRDDTDVAAALSDATDWLLSQQADDGSFGAYGSNANSTGIAAEALALVGEDEAATAAATWVRGRQLAGTACDGALVDDAGAIAYDDAAIDMATAGGITEATRGQWILAGAQSFASLALAPASDAEIDVRAPRFVRAGGQATLRLIGLAPGQRACARIGGSGVAVIGGDTTRVRVPVGKRTGQRTAAVTVAGEAIGTPITALGATTLKVAARNKVARGGEQKVVVRGLEAGERVTVKYGAKRVARGTARDNGRFSARFGVGRATGKKKVVVTGQFGNRRGSATFRVR